MSIVNIERSKYYRIESRHLLINTTFEETNGKIYPSGIDSKYSFSSIFAKKKLDSILNYLFSNKKNQVVIPREIKNIKNIVDVIKYITKKHETPKFMIFEEVDGCFVEFFTKIKLGEEINCYSYIYGPNEGTNLEVIEEIDALETLEHFKNHEYEYWTTVRDNYKEFSRLGKEINSNKETLQQENEKTLKNIKAKFLL